MRSWTVTRTWRDVKAETASDAIESTKDAGGNGRHDETHAQANPLPVRERELPPMPSRTAVIATLRNDQPVAVLVFTDVEGVEVELQLEPAVAMELMMQLGRFCQQVARWR